MLRRILICGLAVGLVSTTATAYAARPKKPVPACKLLIDPEGDGRSTVAGAVISSPALDIVSADVASGTKNVVGVLRLKQVDTANDNFAKLGMRWSLNFQVSGKTYTFTRRRSPGLNETYRYEFNGSPAGVQQPKVVEDKKKNEITFTVPRTVIPDLKRPRMVFNNITASSYPVTANADAATSTKTYPDKHPSCVKVS